MIRPADISVAIPSLDRGEVLLDTLDQLLALELPAGEIIVVDQTPEHPAPIEQALAAHHAAGRIHRYRQHEPGVTRAMNAAARRARGAAVLFLDDDVRIRGELVAAHAQALADPGVGIVAGRIVQPWQQGTAPEQADCGQGDPDAVSLHARRPGPARRFGGGNVCIRRTLLLALEGFDENFVAVGYRFEADFAERALAAGVRIHFEPAAALDHLKVASGGTRSYASPGHDAAPWHSVGRYYYLLRHPRVAGSLRRTLGEALRAVLAREHRRRPARVLGAALGELRGLALAARLRARGPRRGLSAQGAGASPENARVGGLR